MKVIGVSIATLLIAGVVSAKEGPCKADVEKFCKDTPHGGGQVMKCLKEHEAQLSAECKAHGQEAKEKMKESREACEADVEKFCSDVKKGKMRVMKCLKKHAAELSEDCKNSPMGQRFSK